MLYLNYLELYHTYSLTGTSVSHVTPAAHEGLAWKDMLLCGLETSEFPTSQ